MHTESGGYTNATESVFASGSKSYRILLFLDNLIVFDLLKIAYGSINEGQFQDNGTKQTDSPDLARGQQTVAW